MRYIILIALGFSLSGCFATTQSYTDLKSEISSLRSVISQMQANQADLVITMQELNGSMIGLTEKLEDNKNRTSSLSQKLDDIDANFNTRIDNLSMQLNGSSQKKQPAPTQIYDIAINDYNQTRYELAGVSFRNYLERYPQGEMTEKAQYYLGDCLYRSKDEPGALDAFEKFIRLYPRSELIPQARERYDSLMKKAPKPAQKPNVEQNIEMKKPVPETETIPKSIEKKPENVTPKPAEKKNTTIKITPDE